MSERPTANERETQIRALLTEHFKGGQWRESKPRFTPAAKAIDNYYQLLMGIPIGEFIPKAVHYARVSELLEANNREVERRRAAGTGAEIWQIIEALTKGEGNAVTTICANPDFNGQPNHAIDCCGDWTGWQERRFAHDDRAECFRMALAAFNDFSVTQPEGPIA